MTGTCILKGDAVAAEIAAVALSRLVPDIGFTAAPHDGKEWSKSIQTTPLLRNLHLAIGASEGAFFQATDAEPSLALVAGHEALPYGEPGLGLYGDRFWPVHSALAENGLAETAGHYNLAAMARRAGRMADAPADMRGMFDHGYVASIDTYLDWLRPHRQIRSDISGGSGLTITIETPGDILMPVDLIAVQIFRIAAMLRSGRWDAAAHQHETAAEIEAARDLTALLLKTDLTRGAAERISVYARERRLLPGAPFPPSLWISALWPHAAYRMAIDLKAEAQSFRRMAILIEQSVSTMQTVAGWKAATIARELTGNERIER